MIPMSPATRRPQKNLTDLYALPDETPAELIDGEIYVTPSPSLTHQRVVMRLSRVLATYAENRPDREVLAVPFDVHLPTGDVVQPDVVCVQAGSPSLREDGFHGAPDLAIEVLSQAHPLRDRVVTRDLYVRSGVPEYWIVDPAERAIEVFRLEGHAYLSAGYITGDGAFRTPFLPGLELRLAEIFG